MTHEYIGTKQVTAWPQEKDGKPGYAGSTQTATPAGSPKDVFEAAYVDIGHVAHLPPHQQRVIGEKAVLDDKLAKLHKFFETEIYRSLDLAEQQRLVAQMGAMQQYSNILGDRIAAF